MALQLTSFHENVYCMPINLFDSYRGLLYIDSLMCYLKQHKLKTLRPLDVYMSLLKEQYTKMKWVCWS